MAYDLAKWIAANADGHTRRHSFSSRMIKSPIHVIESREDGMVTVITCGLSELRPDHRKCEMAMCVEATDSDTPQIAKAIARCALAIATKTKRVRTGSVFESVLHQDGRQGDMAHLAIASDLLEDPISWLHAHQGIAFRRLIPISESERVHALLYGWPQFERTLATLDINVHDIGRACCQGSIYES